ncbi:MAG: MazG nucleotide pyrophosphohydrolase domain-containing protein [Fervidicoccaceae archaeon]
MKILGIKLSELQELVKREYLERDKSRGVFATFAWLVEEVGELAESLLSGSLEEAEEEIADVIAWTISVANLLGIDVERALLRKYRHLIDAG